MATDKKNALAIIKKHDPKNFILKRQSLVECFNTLYGDPTLKIFTTFTESVVNVYDHRTHVFEGPTGIGKTSFAMSHFENLC